VEDLRNSIAGIHEGKDEGMKGRAGSTKIDFMELLQRLIDAKLIIQEARAMGLDELPEFQNSLDVFRQVTLRGMVREDIVKDVTVTDAESISCIGRW